MRIATQWHVKNFRIEQTHLDSCTLTCRVATDELITMLDVFGNSEVTRFNRVVEGHSCEKKKKKESQ